MVQQFARLARPLLAFPFVRRTRRNHALEHATITVLGTRIAGLGMSGRSTDSGFYLFGDAPTAQVEAAAHEALRRMRAGDHDLALHPHCGTNYVTAGALTTAVAVLTMTGVRPQRVADRLPLVMFLMMLAVLVAQPLGMTLQKYVTTEGDPGDLQIVGVTRRVTKMPFGETVTVHTVTTTQG